MMDPGTIARALAGDRPIKKVGGGFLTYCPCHQDASPSFSVGPGKTPGVVLFNCFAGCDRKDILATMRDRRMVDGTAVVSAPAAVKGTSEYERQQQEKASWLWHQRRPIAGTVAEKYLRDARGYTGPLAKTLGFLSPRKPEQHPAMIAAFGIPEEPEPGVLATPRDVDSVHLTLLKIDGSGKIEAKPNKLIIGRPLCRPIVLAPPNDLLGLAITEGIEDALTAHAATGLGVWAAGAAGFMPMLANTVPDYIEAVTIYAHSDKAGQDGAHKLAKALHHRGIEILIEGIAR
jgi:Toprim domain